MDLSAKQELGRRRLAKLLGIAPYRIDFILQPSEVKIEIDGKPATPEQLKTFWDDVDASLKKRPDLPN